jgi:hypothetical protein
LKQEIFGNKTDVYEDKLLISDNRRNSSGSNLTSNYKHFSYTSTNQADTSKGDMNFENTGSPKFAKSRTSKIINSA